MGRIFVGLCQVGAWGCFDEFNRLEERMLSAVSQQVQCIQEALREHSNPSYDKCMWFFFKKKLFSNALEFFKYIVSVFQYCYFMRYNYIFETLQLIIL